MDKRKEREQLEKAKSELGKEQFNCRPDAELILHQFLDSNQRRVRKALRDAGESLKIPGGRITDRPTISVILDTLRDIHLIHIHTDEGLLRILPRNTDQLALQFLHLIYCDRSIYTAPPRFLTT